MNTLGEEGEKAAVEHLKKSGYRILERNYRTVFGEIDIIAKNNNIVVFIEVKTRSGNQYGQPFEAVNNRKRDKIKKVALCYLKKIREEIPARFDVISIYIAKDHKHIEHIKDAFEV